ncbi:Holliday junction resolvase RuvX [Maricaulis sp.]|jgi:putative pre-16S rRNA nuclease|uniref:Holliday junction resolvase RuvX n=1 Tax=Maricaulis sp. TaxID=1486257 RepID=UPI00261D7C2B|nr:Holliday junction resolvase RuvX [Maricaulis sp.]MDF1768633.1 Holliday junction resolvase RuvX [Maricaulis sp.]
MPIVTLEDLPDGPLIALDPGSKTIGVAACGASRGLSTPVETIKRTKFTHDAERVFALLDERKAVAIVMGLPVNMDGSEGPRVQSVRAMARNLMRLRDLPIVFQDERLSTFEAEEKLISVGVRRDKRKDIIDAHAAANILQSALDRLEMLRP